MASKTDYYDLLGVSKSSSADEIKKAYRKQAMKFHPDRNAGDKQAEARFKEISEAYEVLGDEGKRQQYDRFGHDGLKSAFGPGGFDFSRDFTHSADLQDILGGLFGGGGGGGGVFDEFFGGGGGGGRRRTANGPRRGADLLFDLEIDLEESIFGSEREIALPLSVDCEKCGGSGVSAGSKREACKHCGGRGAVISGGGFFQVRQNCPICGGEGSIVTHPCRPCGGSGRVKTRKRISLRIPKGVESGSRLRLSGKGEGGLRGGPAGDLYVVLHTRPNELFERREDDLFCDVPVPFEVAALGGEIQVPTVDGFAKLKLAPCTEAGKVFRLRGKGVPSLEGYTRGDLHVRIAPEVPARLDARQKKILKELQESRSDANYPAGKRFHEKAEAFYERKNAVDK